jgi:hypothetical protein
MGLKHVMSMDKEELLSMLKTIQKKPENSVLKIKLKITQTCVDCGQKNPQWGSVVFGSWVCMECAYIHRMKLKIFTGLRFLHQYSPTDHQPWTHGT